MSARPKQLPAQQPGSASRPCPRCPGEKPWWFAAPRIALACLWLLFLPIRAITWVADAVIALAVLGFFAVGWMWLSGAIPDAVVTAFLGQLGERVLGLAKAAGAL